MDEYMLEAKQVSFSYENQVKALKEVNFRIKKGEKIALIGANGSGKSTLFLCLNGVLKPQSGEILYRGKTLDYKKQSLLELRSNVGIVFQEPDDQLFSASVFQEISFGPLNLRLAPSVVKQRVEEIMKVLHIETLKDRPTQYLSGGEKKRITIADILVMNPEIILFDEPVSALDPLHTELVYEIIDALSESDITVLISTHDVDHAYKWADRIFVFYDGRMIGDGTPEEIFKQEMLLSMANLKKPFLIKLHEMLQSEGLLENERMLPKSMEELVHSIKRRKNINSKEIEIEHK